MIARLSDFMANVNPKTENVRFGAQSNLYASFGAFLFTYKGMRTAFRIASNAAVNVVRIAPVIRRQLFRTSE